MGGACKGSAEACAQHAAVSSTGGHFFFISAEWGMGKEQLHNPFKDCIFVCLFVYVLTITNC